MYGFEFYIISFCFIRKYIHTEANILKLNTYSAVSSYICSCVCDIYRNLDISIHFVAMIYVYYKSTFLYRNILNNLYLNLNKK